MGRNLLRRIDDQFKGRGKRQGDPGDDQFYLSLEDELIRNSSDPAIRERMKKMFEKENIILSGNIPDLLIAGAQEAIRKANYLIRKQRLNYDLPISKKSEVFYRFRQEVLE